MKKLSMIIIGAGGRGCTYAGFAEHHPDMFEVVGVAEPVAERRNFITEHHPKAKNNAYLCWSEILAQPKMADIAVIATMDRMHFEPAMKAIELGYDLLLEKPMAPTPEECKAICEAAEKKGTRILVCHVLRYTAFFKALKDLIDSGRLGRIMSVSHVEGVGNLHQSHSFVRGNWRNEEESSCMLLQKSCHDMDILQWLVGSRALRVQSFGELSYFTHDNRPEGAPDYCMDGCPHADSCRFHVEKVYLSPKSAGFMRQRVAENPEPQDDVIREKLKKGQFGRCVFACDNDVVDHQIVNLEFENHVYVNFTMNAFNIGGRVIRIMGTDGEVEAAMNKDYMTFTSLDTEEKEEISIFGAVTDESITSGHGGGDDGIMYALHDLISENKKSKSVCDIRTSYENHMIVFAAEKSRRENLVVDVDAYAESV